MYGISLTKILGLDDHNLLTGDSIELIDVKSKSATVDRMNYVRANVYFGEELQSVILSQDAMFNDILTKEDGTTIISTNKNNSVTSKVFADHFTTVDNEVFDIDTLRAGHAYEVYYQNVLFPSVARRHASYLIKLDLPSSKGGSVVVKLPKSVLTEKKQAVLHSRVMDAVGLDEAVNLGLIDTHSCVKLDGIACGVLKLAKGGESTEVLTREVNINSFDEFISGVMSVRCMYNGGSDYVKCKGGTMHNIFHAIKNLFV